MFLFFLMRCKFHSILQHFYTLCTVCFFFLMILSWNVQDKVIFQIDKFFFSLSCLLQIDVKIDGKCISIQELK